MERLNKTHAAFEEERCSQDGYDSSEESFNLKNHLFFTHTNLCEELDIICGIYGGASLDHQGCSTLTTRFDTKVKQ